MSLFCGSVWRRAQKGDSAAAWPLEYCLDGSCPLAFTLMPHTSVSPICHWCPSCCCPGAKAQREWVCVSPKSIVGPSGETSEISSFFCHPNPHWFLQPEFMGTYLPCVGTLGWVVWCGAGVPRSLGILSIFSHHVLVRDHLFASLRLSTCLRLSEHLHPSYPSEWLCLLQFLGCLTSI